MLQDHPKITNNSLFDSPSSGFPIGKFQKWYLHKIHKYITSSVIYSIIMTIFQSIYFMKYHHFWWLNTSKNTIVCHGWSFLSRHLGSPVSPHHGLTTSLRLLGVRSPSAAEMRSEIPYSLHCFRGQFAGKTWKNTVFHGKKHIWFLVNFPWNQSIDLQMEKPQRLNDCTVLARIMPSNLHRREGGSWAIRTPRISWANLLQRDSQVMSTDWTCTSLSLNSSLTIWYC